MAFGGDLDLLHEVMVLGSVVQVQIYLSPYETTTALPLPPGVPRDTFVRASEYLDFYVGTTPTLQLQASTLTQSGGFMWLVVPTGAPPPP
jgi:hypothetical protein